LYLKNYKSTGCAREAGEFENNSNLFRRRNFVNTVFEFIIAVFIVTRFSAAPITSIPSVISNFKMRVFVKQLTF